MAETLRDKIADAIIESGNRYFSDPHELGHRPSVLAIADAVLAVVNTAPVMCTMCHKEPAVNIECRECRRWAEMD